MATTIRDAYSEYQEKCGSDAPPRTLPELRDRIRERGLRYEELDEDFWDELFGSGWAWGTDK